VWEKREIRGLEVKRGQPLFCSARALGFYLLISPFLLFAIAVLTVLTLGLYLLVWLKDRLTGTYLVMTRDPERLWFYLKSTSLEDAQAALRAFHVDR
jgi:hypothetical protein